MLRGLACLGKIREQTARVTRRFNLRQANISRDDGQNIIEIMRDTAGESPERFEFALGKPLFFNGFALTDITQKDRHASPARIRVNLKPNFARGVAGLEFYRHLLSHDPTIIHLKRRPNQLREFLPKSLSDQLSAAASEESLRFRVQIYKIPGVIDRKKSIHRLF